MAYEIYKADGTLVTVPNNTIDVQLYDPAANGAGKGIGTQLIGRNAVDYGEPIAQNFLQLTENFAGTVIPSDTTSLVGQLWFNKTDSEIYVKFDTAGTGITNWKKLVAVDSSETGTSPVINPSGTPADGDMQIVGSVISIYANGAWRQIYPAVYS